MQLPAPLLSIIDQAIAIVYGFQPWVEPTVVLVPPFVRTYVGQLSDMVGFDVETLNYTLGMFLCYPLAMIMNALPYGQVRHVFSFLLGAFLLQFTLGVQWIHQLITSLVAYAMFVTLPRKVSKAMVPAFVLVYLVLGHLHRQYINYLGWDLDFTGSQMVLTQKLWMIAYNLYDGEVLQKGKDDKAAKKCSQFALAKLPNLIEFLGYTFCFSSALSGPAFEFSWYKSACEGSHIFDSNGKPRGKIPSNVWPSLRPFLMSLLCLGQFIVGNNYFPLLDPADTKRNTPLIIQTTFLAKPWYYRYMYMWIGLYVVRQKYYFAWKSAEGANNIWYAGFEGFDSNGNPLGWDNANNADIFGFETAPNTQTLSKEWNKKTSLWLTRYTYIRTGGSLIAVYSLSAFWHGFYPGYYLFFLSVPLMTICERLGRKKISPLFEGSMLYHVVCVFFTSLVVEYMVSPFIILALDRSWAVWKSHYFFGHILCAIFYALVSQLPTPKTKAA